MITRKPKQKPVSKREPSAMDLYYEAFGTNGCVRKMAQSVEAHMCNSEVLNSFIKKVEG